VDAIFKNQQILNPSDETEAERMCMEIGEWL
jgi:hypothetical protein